MTNSQAMTILRAFALACGLMWSMTVTCAPTVNYLKIVMNGSQVQYTVTAPAHPPDFYVTGANTACTGNTPYNYLNSSTNTWYGTPPPGTLTVTSSDLTITLSIQNTPPAGGAIHYYGVNEVGFGANNTVYVAGVPSKINVKPIYSDTLTPVTLGGSAVVLPAQFDSFSNYVVPSILLPDQTLILNVNPIYVTVGNYTLAGGPFSPWCGLAPTGQYWNVGHNPPFGTTQIVTGGASLWMVTQGTKPVAVNDYGHSQGTGNMSVLSPGLTLSANAANGILYTLNAGNPGVSGGFSVSLTGNVGYVIGF